MNLKDRLNKEEKKPGNSTVTTQKSNPQSAEQTLLSKVKELSAALTAAKDDLAKEKQRTRTLDRTISKLSSQNSTLTSKMQEQQSLITALRTEISETQDINRSLQEDNQRLIRENEDLRFDHGVESRKEVDNLRNEISLLRLRNDDLNKQVDQSCVAAVREAYDELERSRRKADRQLDSYQAFVAKKLRGILDERNQSVAALNHKIKARAGSLWLSRDLLLVYAICSLAANPVILLDLWEILSGAGLLLREYYEWIKIPCYYPYPGAVLQSYEPETALAVRTISVIAGLAFAIIIAFGCKRAYAQIRSQWCKLATRTTVSLLIIVSVLGPLIKKYLQWNTAVLFLILSVIAMVLMHRIEVLYARSHKADEWENIKEHNDKSFYVTYHIYRLFLLESGRKKKRESTSD